MNITHSLAVVIGATLQGGFGATMNSGRNQLMQLGQTIKQLETDSKSINTFQTLHRDMLLARRAWFNAETQVKSLADQMAATTTPSKALQTEFDRSAKAALKAKSAYLQKQEALQTLDHQLRSSGYNMAGLVAEQTKLGSSLAKLKSQYADLSALMQKRQDVLNHRSQLRSELVDAVALGATLMVPIHAAMDFEQAMNRVKQSVNIQNPKALQQIGDTLQTMSRTIPISAVGLAQIAASGGKLGIGVHNIAAFTKNIATMSMAFNMSADDMGQVMAKMGAVYHLSMNQMGLLGDALQVLSRKMVAKPEEIITALQKIGAAAQQCGLSAVQTSSLASSLISLGRAPEKAGTSIQLFLTKLSTATQQSGKFQNALQRMGYSATSLTEAIGKDAQGAILQFLQTLSQLDAQKRSGILVDLFGMRAQGDVALLVNSLDTYKKALSAVGAESQYAGTLQQTLANKSKTAAVNFTLFKNALTEMGISLGSTLLPPLTSLLQGLRALMAPVLDGIKMFPMLTKTVIGVTATLMGLKVAAIGVGYGWTFIQGAVLAVTTAWKVLTIACATNPIGMAVAGLAIAATLIITNWQSVQTFFKNIWKPVQKIWASFKNWVSSFWESISKPFESIGNLWGKFFNGTPQPIKSHTPKTTHPMGVLKTPLAQPSQTITHNNNHHHNHITVHVQAAPQHDTKKIADEVIKRMTSQNKGILFDPVGGRFA